MQQKEICGKVNVLQWRPESGTSCLWVDHSILKQCCLPKTFRHYLNISLALIMSTPRWFNSYTVQNYWFNLRSFCSELKGSSLNNFALRKRYDAVSSSEFSRSNFTSRIGILRRIFQYSDNFVSILLNCGKLPPSVRMPVFTGWVARLRWAALGRSAENYIVCLSRRSVVQLLVVWQRVYIGYE